MQCYGCLFCCAGSEHKLADKIRRIYPQIEVVVPEKLRHRRFGGQLIAETVILFPAYLFLKADEDFQMYELSSIPGIYKILSDGDNNWKLNGTDAEIAKKIFENNGCIGFSKAYYEGDRIKIAYGFLKGQEGNIIRVNRKAQTAEVKINFNDKIFFVWCGLLF